MKFFFEVCLRGLLLSRLIGWIAESSLKDGRFSTFALGEKECSGFSSFVSEKVGCSKKSKTSEILEFSSLGESFMSKSEGSWYDFIEMVLNLIDPLNKFKIADSFSMLMRLNGLSQMFDRPANFSRYINTGEFKSRSWRWIVENPLRVLKTSLIWRLALSFRISFITFFIVIARWLIVGESAFNFVIREYARILTRWKLAREIRQNH